jgi:uncharacterized protein
MLNQTNSKASMLSLGLLLAVAMFSLSILSNSTLNNYSTSAIAQPFIETVKYRDLVIDLGNGIQTNAQLTIPAVGNGPFPGVLLVAGSGAIDMNVTISPDIKPFWQIAQYLSERGFVVLRYDKRGVGENGTIIDTNVWGNATFDNLKNDAARALNILTEQPEVDPDRITLIGHSEGTVIIPRLAMDLNNNNTSTGNLTKVANIVLMSTVAQNLFDVIHAQVVDDTLAYAHQVLDKNHTGSFSIREPIELPELSEGIATHFGNSSTAGYIDIEKQLKPLLERVFENITSGDTEDKCSVGTCPIWIRSHGELEPTLNVIDSVSESTDILMMNGENDTQTPVQQAFLLEQRLTEVNHPDHTLITYPDLGHVFSPSSQWFTEFGPVEQNVLSDLHRWLSDHTHGFRGLDGG